MNPLEFTTPPQVTPSRKQMKQLDVDGSPPAFVRNPYFTLELPVVQGDFLQPAGAVVRDTQSLDLYKKLHAD